ncbi:hypothetical protein L484_015608 [Morus notabilis]|uniref:Uncharacterized protein n=1 Tax=Morus notabilis TaxID=981085 RepID=W9QY10_9ROSA|nr:hypothetical protein L484_015608 [Morus notabilis]
MAGTLATCARSSGGAQPPPAPEPRQCRGRCGAKGYEIAQKVLQDGKITVEFDEAGGTWKALGKYGAWFDSAVGIHTRDICEPFHDAWKDISDVNKRTIQDWMLLTMRFNDVKLFCNDWFNMDYNYKNGILRSVVNREAAKCYKDWKSSLHRHYKRYGRESLPSNMRNQVHCDRCCDRFSGDKFQKISETNRSNRSNQKYPSLHGRLSYSQYRNKKASTETQELMSAIDNWTDMHRRGDSWVNTHAEQTFNTLEEERQMQRTQTTSSATRPPLDEHGVLEQVLGMRRGHKKGVGLMLSQKHYSGASPSSAGSFSNATSSAQPDPHMDRYLKKSYREQMKIYDNQPNIQLPTIARPEPINLDAHLPPSDDDSPDDDSTVGDAANLDE